MAYTQRNLLQQPRRIFNKVGYVSFIQIAILRKVYINGSLEACSELVMGKTGAAGRSLIRRSAFWSPALAAH